MLLHKNRIILFGGYYDSGRDMRWGMQYCKQLENAHTTHTHTHAHTHTHTHMHTHMHTHTCTQLICHKTYSCE